MTNSIRVVIATQYLENYGAHDWDGEGVCPQYWKPKGGSTYIVSASAADIACPKWWDSVENTINSATSLVESLDTEAKIDDWLIDQTETFCQDKAIYNAIMSGIEVIEKTPEEKGVLPGLLQEALQVSLITQ